MKQYENGAIDSDSSEEEEKAVDETPADDSPSKAPQVIARKKTKEEIDAEKQAKKELKKKNSEKVKKIWRSHSKEIFPDNFEQMDDAELSSKFIVIANMLSELFSKLEEKIIIVSNYTETLEIFEQLCRKRGYPFIRFDGKTNIGIR